MDITKKKEHVKYDRSPLIPRVLGEALRVGALGDDTPVALFMDMGRLAARTDELRAAFVEQLGLPLAATTHAFAVKACPLKAVMQQLCEAGFGAECASLEEVQWSLACGFDSSSLVFDSPCKTSSDIRFCIQHGVYFNCDNFEELERVGSLLSERGTPASAGGEQLLRIGLRINPQLGMGSIASTSTASKTSKFGQGLKDAHDRILAAFADYPWLNSLHAHVGSQGCEMGMLVDGARAIVDLALEVNAQAGGRRIRILDIGGGLPANYDSDSNGIGYAEYARALSAAVPQLSRLSRDGVQVFTEFGRSMVQKAGWFASKVEYCKNAGGRRIATVHVGSNLLVRTGYLPNQWAHHVTVHESPSGAPKQAATEDWSVGGPLCFSGDMVATDRLLPAIEAGDYIVVHDAGGYTYSMYSRYNSRRAPPVYAYDSRLCHDGGTVPAISVVKPAETLAAVAEFWGGQAGDYNLGSKALPKFVAKL